MRFQSTRLSRASTVYRAKFPGLGKISIHKALASLDNAILPILCRLYNFNPPGSREPRRCIWSIIRSGSGFQSTRLSRASTIIAVGGDGTMNISIHKALASLDSKIIQTYSTSPLTFYTLCSSLPSSTNSVHSPSPLSRPFPLFFRCESPWHFMLAWHSHLV